MVSCSTRAGWLRKLLDHIRMLCTALMLFVEDYRWHRHGRVPVRRDRSSSVVHQERDLLSAQGGRSHLRW